MGNTTGVGSQKAARFRRLREEIIMYVGEHPGCTAHDIVAALAIDRKMKNHGLTPRKVGFFIPRHCKEIAYTDDTNTGKRLYAMAADEEQA